MLLSHLCCALLLQIVEESVYFQCRKGILTYLARGISDKEALELKLRMSLLRRKSQSYFHIPVCASPSRSHFP